MLKIIETFSGIGSQAQALKNIGVDYEIGSIVEWEIGAMYAYDIIHNGEQDLSVYRHHNKDSLIQEVSKYNISNDGNEPLSGRAIASLNVQQLKAILHAIENNNNLVDITKVTAESLPNSDILTYSFPCQDLSVSSRWHFNSSGIDRDAENRSTLLWQIERILIEYSQSNKDLPKFLLMENVSNILSDKHIHNFKEWQEFLESIGYYNQVYTLDSRNFGVPQSRVRTYMISVLAPNQVTRKNLDDYFFENNLETIYVERNTNALKNYLKVDYSNELYREEAIASTPTYTPSREKIYLNNPILATDKAVKNTYARTVTTKQDRHPNSGIVEYKDIVLTEINNKYRNLTPRECFLLMGFDEKQYDLLMENNFKISGNRKMLSSSKLIQLAGNSIVVPVLEVIFRQMIEINEKLLTVKEKVYKS